MLGIDIIDLQNISERELINEGFLAEQFVGQNLFNAEFNSLQSGLYYWIRESSKSNAEVDYAVAKGSLICPIEVKAGKSGSLRSLHQLMFEKKLKYAIRFDLQRPSEQHISTMISTGNGLQESSYSLISLPLYCAELLPKIMEELKKDMN